MKAIRKQSIAHYTLMQALAGKPDLFKDFRNAVAKVRQGKSIVWEFDDDTLMVTTEYTGGQLFIDAVISGTPGTLKRNWGMVLTFMKFSHLQTIVCNPLGPAQARLYRIMGFTPSRTHLMKYEISGA